MIDATRDTHDRLAEARADAAEAELQALGHYTQSLRESLELWDKVVSFEREELFDDEGREIWSRIGLRTGRLEQQLLPSATKQNTRGFGTSAGTWRSIASLLSTATKTESTISWVKGTSTRLRQRLELLPQTI